MKRLIAPITFGIALAIASHFAVLYAAPGFIMNRAMTMLADRGIEQHAFNLGPRTTPETQSVVRPSPDLAYSACLFDLDEAPGGLLVSMAASENYASLSFFDASTNNFATYRGEGKPVTVRLLPPGVQPSTPDGITTPSSKGIILIRRLAPTLADYNAVTTIAMDDRCEVIEEEG